MPRSVVAYRRSRSRTPERVDVVYCLQVIEMERAYLDGPTVSRHLPDLYGPSEQSLYDWCMHVWDGLECRFWGQWSYKAYLMRITIFSAVQRAVFIAVQESAVAEEDNGIDDPGMCVESLGMRHYILGGGTTTLLWDDRLWRQAQIRRWREFGRLELSMARLRDAIPRTPLLHPDYGDRGSEY